MPDSYDIGDEVKWKWGASWAHGKITQRFTKRVSRTINGSEVVRNADRKNPAYLIEQDDGDRVLKSHGELSKDS